MLRKENVLAHHYRFTESASSYLEGVLGDGFNHLLEGHFGGEGVSVVDDRFTPVSIPAVQLHAAAALIQRPVSESRGMSPPRRSGGRRRSGSLPDVRLGAAGAGDLVLGQVSVVRRGDEVMGQGPAHVLVDHGVVGVEDVVLLGQHVHGEAVLGHELVLLSCREGPQKSNQRFSLQ